MRVHVHEKKTLAKREEARARVNMQRLTLDISKKDMDNPSRAALALIVRLEKMKMEGPADGRGGNHAADTVRKSPKQRKGK